MNVLPLIMGSVVLSVIGQLSLKTGMDSIAGALDPPALILKAMTTPFVLLGFATYAVSAVLWLLVLSRAALSYAYPALAVNYVLVVASSVLILREPVSLTRWVAVLVICAGVVLLARN